MKILDIDMDYFMCKIAHIDDSITDRLPENEYGNSVWTADQVRTFLENNLGLSKENKIKGRIVKGHNEALFFWKELIAHNKLNVPFEVIHVDSHADLGLGFQSVYYIMKTLLAYPVDERSDHCQYKDFSGNKRVEGIGDYLLFAIAYQWISKLTYCSNENRLYGDRNDYVWETIKDFHEEPVWDDPVESTIQLLFNPSMDSPHYNADDKVKENYLKSSKKEPEVPFLIIPTVKDVKYNGDFDYAVLAQSPNYTPASADFIIDIFREYIDEC